MELTAPSVPADLEARLRPLVPRILVRERALANEPDPAWYVYREGHWVADAQPEWWDADDAGRLRYSADLRIVDANEAAARLLGLSGADQIVGRHYSEFVPPGAAEDADMLSLLLFEVGELGGTLAAYRADGQLIHFEHHTELRPDGVETVLRAAPGTQVEPVEARTPSAAAIRLEVQPESDGAFSAYARTALDRMAEPSPTALQQLVRRLYPQATVEPVAGRAWVVARDGRRAAADPADGWWRDDTLGRITWDAETGIVDADEAAHAELGLPFGSLVGRHLLDLVPTAEVEESRAQLRLVAARDASTGTILLGDGRGGSREIDHHTERQGDRFVSVIRRRATGAPRR